MTERKSVPPGHLPTGVATPSDFPVDDNRPTRVDPARVRSVDGFDDADASVTKVGFGVPNEAPAGIDGTTGDPTEVTVARERPRGQSASPIHFTVWAQTDVGLVREHNEDNYLVADLGMGTRNADVAQVGVTPKGAILAVCDGMGGAAAGEVASQTAVDTIHELMGRSRPFGDRDAFARRLVRAIEEAGQRILAMGKSDRKRHGMGTTATVAGLIDKVLFVGQVGDSRAYLLRGEHFRLITKDQSLVNQLIEAGQLTEEEAENFEHANIILQALGTMATVNVDLTFLELRQGDRLLMCSDGLSGLVHAELMKEVVRDTASLQDAATRLIEMAKAGGGHDNITVVLADFQGSGLGEPNGDVVPSYQQYPLPSDAELAPDSLSPQGKAPAAPATGPAPVTAHAVSPQPAPRSIFPAILFVVLVLFVASAATAAYVLLR